MKPRLMKPTKSHFLQVIRPRARNRWCNGAIAGLLRRFVQHTHIPFPIRTLISCRDRIQLSKFASSIEWETRLEEACSTVCSN
jgi:hypothetical protein